MSEKAKVKSITFTYKEGYTWELPSPLVLQTWAQAKTQLLLWSASAPKDGGYNKTGFEVEWENGDTYKGRYDLQFKSDCDLAGHIKSYLLFLAGYALPAHMTPERYAAYLESVAKHSKEAARMLEVLSLED